MVFHEFASILRPHGTMKESRIFCATYVVLSSNELMNKERMGIDNDLGERRLKRVGTIADGQCLL